MESIRRYHILNKMILLFLLLSIVIILIKLYFKPFWALICIFIISSPLYNYLIRKEINCKISGILSIVFVNVVLFLMITILSKSLYDWILKLTEKLNEIFNQSFFEYDYITQYLRKIQIIDALNFIDKGSIAIKIRNTGSQFVAYFIGNIVCYFIFTEKKLIYDFLCRILSSSVVYKIKIQKDNIVRMILVELKLVIISTAEIVIGFFILQVKGFILLGIVCGILDVLPFVGTILVFMPLVIYNIIIKKYFIALGLVFLYILVEVMREILEAKLLSSKLKIHPIIIFLSIYIGIEMFGVIGMIFGPLYCIIARDFVLDSD